ncbi:MAG: penicillin-binding protein 2 [Pseudomonadota bacterium]|nr:penicillin-binding protein 2 [Pseudomonadota bacterium]
MFRVVNDADDSIKLSSNQVYKRTIPMQADRGDILDRNGHLLAGTTTTYQVWIDPVEFEASSNQIEQLVNIINLDEVALMKKINQLEKRYVLLAKGVSKPVADRIADIDNKTIHVDTILNRIYPLGDAASTVIGLVDDELIGIDGIELAFDKTLVGTNGYKQVLKDRHGHIVKYITEKKPISGHNVSLTIDSVLQIQAHKALLEAVEKSNAKSAMAVIIHVESGEIKAMVNWPTFDPNSRNKLAVENIRNRVVADMFEPGSTMKPFAMAHLLETKAWSEDDTVDATKGFLRMDDGHIVKDVHVSKEPINMQQVIQKSSNVAVAKMMTKEPSFDFVDMLPKYGFCRKTLNELPGEINGVCHANYDSLFALSTLSFGYGIGVNTLQLAQAFSVLANDGVFVASSIEMNSAKEAPYRVISTPVAKAISRMLLSVAKNGGTGQKATLNGINVAGKTGTSYLVGKNGYDHSKHLSSFVGFAPAEKPQYIVAVVLKEPDYAYRYGGIAAAPVFAQMMSAALGYEK